MRELARQMEKAGYIQEIVAESIDSKDVEEEADEEVDRVLAELTANLNLPNASKTKLTAAEQQKIDQQQKAKIAQ